MSNDETALEQKLINEILRSPNLSVGQIAQNLEIPEVKIQDTLDALGRVIERQFVVVDWPVAGYPFHNRFDLLLDNKALRLGASTSLLNIVVKSPRDVAKCVRRLAVTKYRQKIWVGDIGATTDGDLCVDVRGADMKALFDFHQELPTVAPILKVNSTQLYPCTD